MEMVSLLLSFTENFRTKNSSNEKNDQSFAQKLFAEPNNDENKVKLDEKFFLNIYKTDPFWKKLIEKVSNIKSQDECKGKLLQVVEEYDTNESCAVVENNDIGSLNEMPDKEASEIDQDLVNLDKEEPDQEIPAKVNENVDSNTKKCGGCGEIAVNGTFGLRKYPTIIECTECNKWYHKEKSIKENCAKVAINISKKEISSWKCEGCVKLKETTITPKDDETKETETECQKCNKSNDKTSSIMCTDCNIKFHKKCVGLRLNYAKDKEAIWKCNDCICLKEANNITKETNLLIEAKCKKCNKSSDETSIMCTSCSIKFHKKCVGVRKNYAKAKEAIWKCNDCDSSLISKIKNVLNKF